MRPALFSYVLAVILLVCGCSSSEHDVTLASVMNDSGPVQETWNPSMYINEMGRPLIHMRADYMARYETPDSTWLVLSSLQTDSTRVRVDLFDQAGDSSAVVWAEQITWFEEEGRFTARGNVLVQSGAGDRLTSEHLIWNEETRRIQTPGFVTLQQAGNTLRGYQFDANEDLTEFTMTGGPGGSGVVIRDGE